MTRKRKSNLTRSSKRARAAKVLRAQESTDKTNARRLDQVKRQQMLRNSETHGQSQARRALDAQRHASLRAAETKEMAHTRRTLDAQRYALLVAAETSEQRQTRRNIDAKRHASQRARETSEKTQARRALDARRHADLKAAETSEESQLRRNINATRQSNRRLVALRKKWGVLNKAAFEYDPLIDFSNHRLVALGKMDKTCKYCKALKWKGETASICCSGGKVSLATLGEPEEPLKKLFTSDSQESRRFLDKIRKYNSCFQMTSFGANQVIRSSGFSPTFTVQGQVYHRIGSLLPVNNEKHSFLQIYFMGNEYEEVSRRCQNIGELNKGTVLEIQRMLHKHNHLVTTFKMAVDRMPEDVYKLVVPPDRTLRYNAQVINGVAAIVTGEQFEKRDIVLHTRSNNLTRVPDTHKYYDALQYPIIFSKGQEGYHFQIPQIDPETRFSLPHKKVSCMDFYAYHMMVRKDDFNVLSRCRQLASQFYVDMYVKVESERLRYIALNQKKLRTENYVHLHDAVANDANVNPDDLGKLLILPSSFINSPRYQHQYVQDAFTYVRAYGRPDLFITFTCNPAWPEIVDELIPGQKSFDRHDLIARVFRLKVKKLKSVIMKGKLYGEALCILSSIEWQKRGLPHAHVLLWLKDKFKSDQIDNLISAEIPDPSTDKILHDIVVKHMIHDPCGNYNPQSPCMKNSTCKSNFPRQLQKETVLKENGYLLYRRRAPADEGRTVSLKIWNGNHVTVDNSWVVPYSPILSKMFNAHINVDTCGSISAIKYICKYVNSSSRQVMFNFKNDNEISTYQSGRYVSSNEAVWRLLGFPLHERHPALIHLSVHLENGERIYFRKNNLHDLVSSPPKTTLTAFFELCSEDNFARTLLYVEVPKYYIWNASKKTWKRRVKGTPVENWPGVKSSDVLGRVYNVHMRNMECYCLRLLLHHVRGPTCFKDLRRHNGQDLLTFRETCEVKGLLESDKNWESTLEEAANFFTPPSKLRDLFAILITCCGISNPQQLWEKYQNSMSKDILKKLQASDSDITHNPVINNEALLEVENKVYAITGKYVSHFGMNSPLRNEEVKSDLIRELDYDIVALEQQLAEYVPRLNPEQKIVFDNVILNIESKKGGLFFLDAPGGTGKTYLLNLLLAQVRKNKRIALAVASSGIAATLLHGGGTAHSILKLPFDLTHEESPTCNISISSDRGQLLQHCELLVWDECTMSHKKAIEALDRTMKDIKGNQKLMGGMVVLLAGDFRQILPVIAKGTAADEINACLKASTLWQNVEKLSLTTNMRIQLHNDTESEKYAAGLLEIGEDRIAVDNNGMITLNHEFCNAVRNTDELISKVYAELKTNGCDKDWLRERAILAPTNERVNQINEKIMSELDGAIKEYMSIDSIVDNEATSYPVEFLNSLELAGEPSHKLRLKIGVPVLLMRNIDAPRLCNGTRLQITNLGENVIKANILTGVAMGEQVLIPRIPILSKELPFQFKRLQFPLKVAYAMTINKAQGQTLKVAGVHLEHACFSHGQLYVACSRVSSPQNLHVLTTDGKTKNVVYNTVLT